MSPEKNKSTHSKIERYYKIVLINWQLVFKVFELILSVVNIVVIYQPAQEIGFGIHELKQIGVIYTAYSTSVLIVATILIGYIIGERFPYRTYAIFCVLSSILYAFSAAILTYQCVHLRDPIFHPSEQNMQLLVGSVVASIVNCVVLAADGLLTVVKTEPF